MPTWSSRLDTMTSQFDNLCHAGVIYQQVEDRVIHGRHVTLEGKPKLNFGSCSYLGLEMEPHLKAGAIDALERYGTQFSSSRAYLELPLYAELEGLLNQMTGGHTLVTGSTTLAHLAALPSLIDERDLVFVDHQAHASIHMAVDLLKSHGATVKLLRHNAIGHLETKLNKQAGSYRKVWYLADGIYSMHGDTAPMDILTKLQDRFPNFHLYIDDAHGFGWRGKHGCGFALEATPQHARTVVVASLSKSFGGGGGVIICPDDDVRSRILHLGGPMVFAGPLQPPVLGANIASAKIHLANDFSERQQLLKDKIRFCNKLLNQYRLPLVTCDDNPIRFLAMGKLRIAKMVAQRLFEAGFWVNIATFPAVSMKSSGIRLTITYHHTHEDIQRLVACLAETLQAVLAETHESLEAVQTRFDLPISPPPASTLIPRPPDLRLEHYTTIRDLDAETWNHLLGERGCFDAATLALLERNHQGPSDFNTWRFHYYLVRDATDKVVLATFFTDALWKNDAFSSAHTSEAVEEKRKHDPLHQVSRVFSMGCPLTEGDHLFLDPQRSWADALRLLLQSVRSEAERAGAQTTLFRDLSEEQDDITAFLLDEGFARAPLPNSMVVELEGTEEAWLSGLSRRQRYFIRREVYPKRAHWTVRVVDSEHPMDAQTQAHVRGLYDQVKAKSLRINSYPVPPNLIEEVTHTPGWELLLLYPTDPQTLQTQVLPAAMGVCFRGESHYVPLLAGLDYTYVASHGAYRQLLYQMIRRALELGLSRVHMGLDAELEKRRMGARPRACSMLFQTDDSFDMDALTHGAITRFKDSSSAAA